MVNNIFRAYLSHHIRGPNGINATKKEIQDNIDLYRKIGEQIRAYFLDWEKMDGFPKIDLYVPADHDEFVQIAHSKKYLDEKQILDVDCGIINACDLVIAYGNVAASRGMQVEVKHATLNGIAIYSMPSLSNTSIQALKFAIHLLLKSEGD